MSTRAKHAVAFPRRSQSWRSICSLISILRNSTPGRPCAGCNRCKRTGRGRKFFRCHDTIALNEQIDYLAGSRRRAPHLLPFSTFARDGDDAVAVMIVKVIGERPLADEKTC